MGRTHLVRGEISVRILLKGVAFDSIWNPPRPIMIPFGIESRLRMRCVHAIGVGVGVASARNLRIIIDPHPACFARRPPPFRGR